MQNAKPNRVDQLTCWSFVGWHFRVVWSNMSVTCWPRRCPMHWLMHCWEPIPYHTHTIILIIWPWKFLLLKDAFLRYYDVWRFNVNIHICDLKAQQSQLPNVHLGTWVIKTLHAYIWRALYMARKGCIYLVVFNCIWQTCFRYWLQIFEPWICCRWKSVLSMKV